MASGERKYATAAAFRVALEARLKRTADTENLDLQRLMRSTAFDRLLARLFAGSEAPWVLKGGYALELRFKEARVTRDLDLALRQAPTQASKGSLNDAILAALDKAAKLDRGDYFSFRVGAPMLDLDGAPYGGARFPVEARLAVARL